MPELLPRDAADGRRLPQLRLTFLGQRSSADVSTAGAPDLGDFPRLGAVTHQPPRSAPAVGLIRLLVGIGVLIVLAVAFTERIAAGDASPWDFFGFFTNQTSLWAGIVYVVTGVLMLLGRPVPAWLTTLRAICTTCLIVVAVVYNGLVPGTGTASAWVSAVLHIVFPTLVCIDWLAVGDRCRLPWARLWVVLPYPIVWLVVVLFRGATDGWVPYGFLLPERGTASLTAHVAGLLAALLGAGSIVWAASRYRGLILRHSADEADPRGQG